MGIYIISGKISKTYFMTVVSINAPGFKLKGEGEVQPEQSPARHASAKTKIGGKVEGSIVHTVTSGGQVETEIGEDVKNSEIKTKA